MYLGTKPAGVSRSLGDYAGHPIPHLLLHRPFLMVSLGQPQGNPLDCTPLVANGSGHPSELGGARRTGNGALGGPKAHRKLQTHPSLASQGSKKSKGSTKSAASQSPLQAQEGKHPLRLPRGEASRSLMQGVAAASLLGCLEARHPIPTPGPQGPNLWVGPRSLDFNKLSRESDAGQRTLQRTLAG